MYQSLSLNIDQSVATVSLARPEVSNAFDARLIQELHQVFQSLANNPSVRVVVLRGQGKHFCAGADLNWMKAAAQASQAENESEARRMSDMFDAIARCSKPTIAVVHGLALGGGAGLVAACDMALAVDSAQLAFTEVRLGIVPAVISPYVLRAIGARAALRYFQTAERINAETALRIGLVQEIAPEAQFEVALQNLITALLQGAPNAQNVCKTMIREWSHCEIDDQLRQKTAKLIADIRTKPEAQQGFSAFFAKQKAPWVV